MVRKTLEELFPESLVNKLKAAGIGTPTELKRMRPSRLMQVAGIGPEKAYDAYRKVGLRLSKKKLNSIYQSLEERRKIQEGVKKAGKLASDVFIKGKHDRKILNTLTKTHKTLANLQEATSRLAFAGKKEEEIPKKFRTFKGIDFTSEDVTRDVLKQVLDQEFEEDMFKNKPNNVMGIFLIRLNSDTDDFEARTRLFNNLDGSIVQEFPIIQERKPEEFMKRIKKIIDNNNPKTDTGQPKNRFWLIYKEESVMSKILDSDFYSTIEDKYFEGYTNVVSYDSEKWNSSRIKNKFRENIYVERMIERFQKIKNLELKYIREGTAGTGADIGIDMRSFWAEGGDAYLRAELTKLMFGVLKAIPDYKEKDFRILNTSAPDVEPPLNVFEFRRMRGSELKIIDLGDEIEVDRLEYAWASHVLNGKFTLHQNTKNKRILMLKSREVLEFGCIIGGEL